MFLSVINDVKMTSFASKFLKCFSFWLPSASGKHIRLFHCVRLFVCLSISVSLCLSLLCLIAIVYLPHSAVCHNVSLPHFLCSFKSSFIHSLRRFTHLQGSYSKALPTLARLKRRFFRLEWNVSERILGNNLCDKRSPFHTEGPTTENARPAWVVEVRAKGTKSNPCSDERSELRPLLPGVHWDSRDLGGRPKQDPGCTSRLCHQYEIWSAAGGAASGVHQACIQIRMSVYQAVYLSDCMLLTFVSLSHWL